MEMMHVTRDFLLQLLNRNFRDVMLEAKMNSNDKSTNESIH